MLPYRSSSSQNGDVLRVKYVVTDDLKAEGFVDSDWVEFICDDDRITLAAPVSFTYSSKVLRWEKIDGVDHYVVEVTQNGHTSTRVTNSNSISVTSGAICVVYAYPSDLENYRPSAPSEPFVCE